MAGRVIISDPAVETLVDTNLSFLPSKKLISTSPRTKIRGYTAPIISTYIAQSNFVPFGQYAMATSTLPGAYSGLGKHTKAPLPTYDPTIMEAAYNDYQSLLAPFEGTTKVFSSPLDVPYVGSTSPGPVFTRLGSPTKADVVANHKQHILDYDRRAHKEGIPSLHAGLSKREILEIEKIEDSNLRLFVAISVDFLLSTGRILYDQHELLVSPEFRALTGFCCGFSFAHGGFGSLIDRLAALPVMGEGDCSKYDASARWFLYLQCARLSYFMWDKKNMSEDEWWSRMYHNVSQMMASFIVMPDGVVAWTSSGTKSGHITTTDWNCHIHMLIWAYLWRKTFSRSLFESWDDEDGHHLPDWNNNFRLAIYSDDHIFSCSDHLAQFLTFEHRRDIYRELGFLLKPDADKMSRSPIGHTFLGFSVAREADTFVPHFDFVRATDGFINAENELCLDPQIMMDRAFSYQLLSAFNDEGWSFFTKFILYAIARGYPYPSGAHMIPTLDTETLAPTGLLSRSEAKRFWTGLEGGGGFKTSPIRDKIFPVFICDSLQSNTIVFNSNMADPASHPPKQKHKKNGKFGAAPFANPRVLAQIQHDLKEAKKALKAVNRKADLHSNVLAANVHKAAPWVNQLYEWDASPERVPDHVAAKTGCIPDKIIRNVESFSYGISPIRNTTGSGTDPWYGKYMTSGKDGVPNQLAGQLTPQTINTMGLSLTQPYEFISSGSLYPDFAGFPGTAVSWGVGEVSYGRALSNFPDVQNGPGILYSSAPIVFGKHAAFPVHLLDDTKHYQISGCAPPLVANAAKLFNARMQLIGKPTFADATGYASTALEFGVQLLDSTGVWWTCGSATTQINTSATVAVAIDNTFLVTRKFFGIRFYVNGLADRAAFALKADILPVESASGTGLFTSFVLDACTHNLLFEDAPRASLLTEVQEERCTQQKLLLQYRGATISDGGNAGANLNGPLVNLSSATKPSYFDWLTALPERTTNGKLRDGLYMAWVPQDEKELLFMPYKQERGVFCSNNTFEIHIDDPSQSVNIELRLGFEIKTTNTNYEQRVGHVSPHMTYFLRAAQEYVENPTCNPGHNKVGSWLKKAASSVWSFFKNPKTWETIGKVVPVIAKGVSMIP